MILLDRYIQKRLYTHLAILLFGFVGIFFLIDFFERIDNFLERDLPVGLATRYFLMKIPFMMEQVIPIALMLGGVITLGLLTASRELLSLQAAGTPVTRVLFSLVAGSIFFSFLALGIEEWLLPPTVTEANRIWSSKVKNEDVEGIVRAGKVYYRGQKGIYTFSRSTDNAAEFNDFSYMEWSAGYGLSQLVQARAAKWAQGTGWLLRDGLIKRRGEDGAFSVEAFQEKPMALPESPAALFVPLPAPDTLSLTALLVQSKSTDQLVARQSRESLHRKLSHIFLGIPLLLIGLPLLFYLQGRWRLDLSLAVPICCAVAYCFWLLWGGMQSYAQAGFIDPLLASWPLHGIIASVGLFFIRQTGK